MGPIRIIQICSHAHLSNGKIVVRKVCFYYYDLVVACRPIFDIALWRTTPYVPLTQGCSSTCFGSLSYLPFPFQEAQGFGRLPKCKAELHSVVHCQ